MRYLINKELLIILIIYIILTIKLIITDVTLYTNIINPIFWGCILAYFLWYRKKTYIRFCKNRKYFIYIFIISLLHILLYFYLGFILGFSKSPYSHKILSIIKNVSIKIIPILGIEITRSVIVTRNKNNKLAIWLTTILFILVEINYYKLIDIFPQKEEFFKYICSNIIPIISCGILYTYLTLKGSYSLPLVYRCFRELVSILLPILPGINWFISGSVGVLSPVLTYALFKYEISTEKKDRKTKHENMPTKISYTIALILCLTLILFMLGAFKYESIAILSNSMMPTFERGDIIIFKKVNENELKEISENSIIVYSVENKNVAHRVVKKIKKNNTVLYQTKGDRNNVADLKLVEINQIKGIYVFTIKYIGFPSIWLYSYFNEENAKIETK